MAKQIILKEFEFLQCRNKDKENFIEETSFESIEKFILENETE